MCYNAQEALAAVMSRPACTCDMVDEVQESMYVQPVLLQPHPPVQPLPQVEEQVIYITLRGNSKAQVQALCHT